jgi:very-short-patch-repair endonuclease
MDKAMSDDKMHVNRNLREYSRDLRKNMTHAERLLWGTVRKQQILGCQFYRQRIVGNYIVDFFCPKARLVVEVDGSQHGTYEGLEKDRIRDQYMKDHGLQVVRVNDVDVLTNIGGVVDAIMRAMGAPGM